MSETWILLRGLVRQSRHWDDFPTMLAEARPQACVHALDLPGNGSLYREPSPDTVEGMVDALRGQAAAQGLEPPYHLMALSLGGMMAVNWLSRYPEDIAAAVLINTSAAGFNPFWQRLRATNYLALLRHLAFTRNPLPREEAILRLTCNLLAADEERAIALRWAALAHEAPTSRSNALRQLRAAIRFRAPAQLPASVPVLLASGAGDRLVHPACSVTLSGAWRCALRVHPHAGHDLALDAPRWLADTVTDWVEHLNSQVSLAQGCATVPAS